jgi:hypothetical protein
MIKIYRHENKWRIEIVNETFEFANSKDFKDNLDRILKLKEKGEPYKKGY